MDKLALLLWVFIVVLFSCNIDETDRYYSVYQESKRRYGKDNVTAKSYFCKLSKDNDKTTLHFVNENGMSDVFIYFSNTHKNTDTTGLIKLGQMMPYSHRMYFLDNSLLSRRGKEGLRNFNKNSILKYSEKFEKTEDSMYLTFKAASEHYKERSVYGQIIANKDYIKFERSSIFSGGNFYIDSLTIIAYPITSLKKKVRIESLIESNSDK